MGEFRVSAVVAPKETYIISMSASRTAYKLTGRAELPRVLFRALRVPSNVFAKMETETLAEVVRDT